MKWAILSVGIIAGITLSTLPVPGNIIGFAFFVWMGVEEARAQERKEREQRD